MCAPSKARVVSHITFIGVDFKSTMYIQSTFFYVEQFHIGAIDDVHTFGVDDNCQ